MSPVIGLIAKAHLIIVKGFNKIFGGAGVVDKETQVERRIVDFADHLSARGAIKATNGVVGVVGGLPLAAVRIELRADGESRDVDNIENEFHLVPRMETEVGVGVRLDHAVGAPAAPPQNPFWVEDDKRGDR